MNRNKTDFLNSVSKIEKSTGNFSESTIKHFRAILLNEYLSFIAERMHISAINHFVSYLTFSVVVFLIANNINSDISLSSCIYFIQFFAVFWLLSLMLHVFSLTIQFPTLAKAEVTLRAHYGKLHISFDSSLLA